MHAGIDGNAKLYLSASGALVAKVNEQKKNDGKGIFEKPFENRQLIV